VEFQSLIERALATRTKLEDHEQQAFGRSWTTEELVLGLVGDVGDLAKLIQAREGVRDIADVPERLAHELADVLWSTIVLADRCEVDLESAFQLTMEEIEGALAG
jgi:NTP pyrophosphatase (non-canonical NTP hydrolase)